MGRTGAARQLPSSLAVCLLVMGIGLLTQSIDNQFLTRTGIFWLLQFGKIFPLSLFPDCLTIFLSSGP
jgi:membrane protein CcdC involved in cytochrome C biogenesis